MSSIHSFDFDAAQKTITAAIAKVVDRYQAKMDQILAVDPGTEEFHRVLAEARTINAPSTYLALLRDSLSKFATASRGNGAELEDWAIKVSEIPDVVAVFEQLSKESSNIALAYRTFRANKPKEAARLAAA